MKRFSMYIDGEWQNSESGDCFPVINPANQETVAEAAQGGKTDAIKALEAADRAFPEWSRLSVPKRADLLRKASSIVRKKRELIAHTLTAEQGKPLNQALAEVSSAADAVDCLAEEAKKIVGEVIPTETANRRSIIVKQPRGVCVAMTPWNYPVGLLSWKVGSALIAGCTLVVKPTSKTPLSPLLFVGCFEEAGFPKGVINIITGPGSSIGVELVENPLSKMITFTGQTLTGKDIMRRAAAHVKKLVLELGNNAPFIACADADIESAVKGACRKSFDNMGQICNSVNRIYVVREIAENFISRFIDRTKSLTIADGLKTPDADLGPMISEGQISKVKAHIADALSKGAELLYGNGEPTEPELSKGYYFLPTVLTNVNHSMRVMTEETFGPVAPIMVVKDFEEAIELANSTKYGLVAYVYTRDLKTAQIAADRLEYGTVDLNNVSGGHPFYPYCGWKESGLGIELSHYGIEEFLNVKHVRSEI